MAVTVTAWNASADIRYVAVSNASPAAPFATRASAATNIQDAVDVAEPGDEIVVSDGIYATGGRPFQGQLTNRVVVDKPIILRSVNGPSVTTITGYQAPEWTNGGSAVRCVYILSNATLIGFTLTNGATMTNGANSDSAGGGAWCEKGANLDNCIITGNAAFWVGGGVFQGNLTGCILKSNRAEGAGGAYGSKLDHCEIIGNSAVNGGGIADCSARFCNFMENSASPGGSFVLSVGWGGGAFSCFLESCRFVKNVSHQGGGAGYGTATNCVFLNNVAYYYGGGAAALYLSSCTIVGNRAVNWGSGGFWSSVEAPPAQNCIIYYNTAPVNPDFPIDLVRNSCTIRELGPAYGCITNEPAFVDLEGGNLRLQSISPCINAGDAGGVGSTVDADGRPRVISGKLDMGAYEYQGTGMSEFIGWLQNFGLSTDGSVDEADSDGDRAGNREEWRAGTEPTNSASVLSLLPPARVGNDLMLTWHSVPGRKYSVEIASDTSSGAKFVPLLTDIVAQSTRTTVKDTNTVVQGLRFYRVGVE